MARVDRPTKPLGRKAYGSIGHLLQSRLGPGDHHISPGQARICLEEARDRHDGIVVQEKLDGCCVAVAKLKGEIVALNRAGYPAETSRWEHHRIFAQWVERHEERFDLLLKEGERVVGEWLALAHGTRYKLWHDPFVPFDIMVGQERKLTEEVYERVRAVGFEPPRLLHKGGPLPLEEAIAVLKQPWHGNLDPGEGVVYRVERKGKVDFLAKWVRPDKIDGYYLPELSGKPAIWNWHPSGVQTCGHPYSALKNSDEGTLYYSDCERAALAEKQQIEEAV